MHALHSQALDILETAVAKHQQNELQLLDELRDGTFYRLKAEGLEDAAAERETQRIIGSADTEIGNDYAVFLQYVL